MAVIANATILYQSTDPGVRVVLLAVRKVSQNDTIDVSTVPSALFSAVYTAGAQSPTNKALGTTTPAVAGTVLTFSAAFANDAVDVLIIGEAPQ